MIYKEFIPINIIKWYQKYEIGLIRYLLINPCLISTIIWEDVTHDDFNWPTIIDKKIKIINFSNENNSEEPDIGIEALLLDAKIKDQIWYSINKPDKIANRPIRAFPLYSSAWIQFILNMDKYLNNVLRYIFIRILEKTSHGIIYR